ncbi:transposase [Rhizobium sp. CRIBSB]|nr:transposase [Rhizobium sp. CRIBSB]
MTMTLSGHVTPAARPTRTWFTASELADFKLPGLSGAKRKINELAQSQRWALRVDRSGLPLARRRQGRGGGTEYHVAVLPPAATAAMIRRGIIAPTAVEIPGLAANDEAAAIADVQRGRLWSWFDQQSDTARAEAARRLALVDAVEALEAAGMTRSAAVSAVAGDEGVAASTLWNWLSLTSGADRGDRLPLLAPQRRGGGRAAEIDEGAWRFLLSDYLRPEKPNLRACYDRALREYCAPRGLTLPDYKTVMRRIAAEVPAQVITLKREGMEALRETIPAQKRSIEALHALEAVNVDGHRWDVFVRWPDGRIARPMMVAIQDLYSRKILSWRIDETESAVQTRLVFADLFRDWGIPTRALMDNGRAFASKAISGGTRTRFRFQIKEDDPLGLLPQMGIKVQWATPYSGRSKPIERAFRSLCDTVAKHPAFAGAYTGNKPDAKPENYGSRAIDLETFKRVVRFGIEAHNQREGRKTEAAQGRLSFDQVFEASYASAPIGKATPEQLRLALLGSRVVGTDRRTGAVSALGSSWWSPAMSALAGRKVILRYDPDDLQADVHVYGLDGRYLATAELQGRAGFFDEGAARQRAREVSELRKTTRRAAELLDLHTARELAEMMPDLPDESDAAPLSPSVIRPVRPRGMTAAALKPRHQVVEMHREGAAEAVTDTWAAAMDRIGTPLRLVE